LAALPTDLPLLSLQELVHMFGAGPTLSHHYCFNTVDHKQMAVKSLLATLYQ